MGRRVRVGELFAVTGVQQRRPSSRPEAKANFERQDERGRCRPRPNRYGYLEGRLGLPLLTTIARKLSNSGEGRDWNRSKKVIRSSAEAESPGSRLSRSSRTSVSGRSEGLGTTATSQRTGQRLVIEQSRAEQALIEKAMTNSSMKPAAARIKGIPIKRCRSTASFSRHEPLFADELRTWSCRARLRSLLRPASARGRPLRSRTTVKARHLPACRQRSCRCTRGTRGRIPFVQGKFNMGGSGVLEFCGVRPQC